MKVVMTLLAALVLALAACGGDDGGGGAGGEEDSTEGGMTRVNEPATLADEFTIESVAECLRQGGAYVTTEDPMLDAISAFGPEDGEIYISISDTPAKTKRLATGFAREEIGEVYVNDTETAAIVVGPEIEDGPIDERDRELADRCTRDATAD